MPHLTIDYSANLDEQVDLDGLVAAIGDAILGTGLFEPGAVRVRALRAEAYAIADRLPANAYLDMSFRIGKGRSDEEKKRAGAAIFSAAELFLKSLLASPHFALSLEIREIDAELSWKKNTMHARLRSL